MKLSVVVPVFNEEGNLAELVQRLQNVLISLEENRENIFIKEMIVQTIEKVYNSNDLNK